MFGLFKRHDVREKSEYKEPKFDLQKLPSQVPQTEQDDNHDLVKIIKRQESTHPSIGLTPEQAAQYLLDAERGMLYPQCELAEDMEEKDTHLQSELGKRRRSVQGLEWRIVPPPRASEKEIKDAELLTEIIESFTWFDNCIFDATDAILKGFSCQEFTGWENVNGLMLPTGIEFRDPSWFQCHPDHKNEIRLRDGSYEGQALNAFNWIFHTAKSKSGYLSRIGLIRTLVWPFIFKNYSIRDLAEFLEIYGLPIRVGKYPSGATDREKNTLLQAVMQIGHNAGGIIPTGMELDFKHAAEGGAEPFMAMVNWAELSMSKAILGGTLTSQAGDIGSQALGNVHNEVRFEVRDSDAKQLAATLTRDLIVPLYALNGASYSNNNRHPRFEFDLSEPEDLSTYATNLPALVNMGMRISTSWVHDKLQIPVASEDESILKAMAPTMPAFLSATRPKGIATLSASVQHIDPVKAAPAAISGQEWQHTIDPILQPIIDIIQQNDLATAKEKIEALYNDLDSEQLEDIIARGLFVMKLYGQLQNG